VIRANPGPAADFKAGATALNFLKGQVMKLSKASNPQLAGEILRKTVPDSARIALTGRDAQ
jgi:Asp-tRNA(Asn)/Glu-tRNA(Gln) amidotransferase B subunit